MTFGKMFKKIRKAHEMNQVEMAERIKCSQGALSKIERDRLKPTVEVFVRAYRLVFFECVSEELYEEVFKFLHG